MEETITITKQEYDQLVEDQQFLHALQNAGVDNWEGYDYALELLEKDEGEDEKN
jgi:hypothetical protein